MSNELRLTTDEYAELEEILGPFQELPTGEKVLGDKVIVLIP